MNGKGKICRVGLQVAWLSGQEMHWEHNTQKWNKRRHWFAQKLPFREKIYLWFLSVHSFVATVSCLFHPRILCGEGFWGNFHQHKILWAQIAAHRGGSTGTNNFVWANCFPSSFLNSRKGRKATYDLCTNLWPRANVGFYQLKNCGCVTERFSSTQIFDSRQVRHFTVNRTS